MDNFDKIAQYLKHPLVLMGFVLMLIFGVHDKLLEKGIIPTLSADQGSVVVQLMLGYGFWLGVLVVILGFVWQFYKTYIDADLKKKVHIEQNSAQINAIVQTLLASHQQDTQAKDEQIKALTQAVSALSTGLGIDASPSELHAALAALAQGDTAKAKSLFAKTAEKAEQQAKQGAEALRNLGALAFLDNTQEALLAYRRATQLDPGNAEGWNMLGHLLMRIGDLDEAVAAYNSVLALGEQHGDKLEIAAAYVNLGIVYQDLKDWDNAIVLYQKALILNKDLGNKEVIATVFCNLGDVYKNFKDWDNAIALYQKALMLNEDLGRKEGMAIVYSNLGNVYQLRDDDNDLDKAVEYYQKALKLDENLGRKEGMAIVYSNFGNIFRRWEDWDNAIALYQKALTLNEDLGRKEGMANQYNNLGNIYQTRGDLDKAVAFYQQALKQHEDLSHKEGMARDYANLGNVHELQGNKADAQCYYLMSITLYKQLGSPMEQTVQAWLDAL